ncbi:hypothetical protein ACNKHP_05720 [Shigella boydii]
MSAIGLFTGGWRNGRNAGDVSRCEVRCGGCALRWRGEKNQKIIDGSKVSDGDVLQLHSVPAVRTRTAIRWCAKFLKVSGCNPQTTELDGKPLANHLLGTDPHLREVECWS